ncbi:MAG: hypothetical protein ACHQJ4_00825 [Ignavibacteria bacterium]
MHNNTGNIKRRNFFMYLGVSLVGIFSLSKMPWKLFGSKVYKETGGKKKIKIEGNLNAIKRVPEKV